jgi:hypothetical protein
MSHDLLKPVPGASGVNVISGSPLPQPRGSLRGFLVIHFPSFRLSQFGVRIHAGKRWAGLPARPWVDKDGALVKDESTCRVRYKPVLGFDSGQVRWRFSDACTQGLDRYTPGWDR